MLSLHFLITSSHSFSPKRIPPRCHSFQARALQALQSKAAGHQNGHTDQKKFAGSWDATREEIFGRKKSQQNEWAGNADNLWLIYMDNLWIWLIYHLAMKKNMKLCINVNDSHLLNTIEYTFHMCVI